MGGWWGMGWCCCGSPWRPLSWGCQMPPKLFFDNLVKKWPNCQKITWGHQTPPVTSPCYFLAIWWKNLITYHCKPTSNIDIYPSTLILVENIGHKYDFQGSGVVSGRVWGWVWSRSKEKSFNRLLIHISNVDRYKCLKLVYSDSLSSFFTKLSNNNMGAIWHPLWWPPHYYLIIWWKT